MKNALMIGVGVLMGFSLFVSPAEARKILTQASLVETAGLKNQLTDLDGQVICSNDRDDTLALMHAGDIAPSIGPGFSGIHFGDGTSCSRFYGHMPSFATGRASEPYGKDGPLIAEVTVPDGVGYMIISKSASPSA